MIGYFISLTLLLLEISHGSEDILLETASEDILVLPRSTTDCKYIQHYSGKCIHPLRGSSKPPPGTNLVLHGGCNEKRLHFCKRSDGAIMHVTSGLCIAPRTKSNPPNDDALQLSRDCTHKFVFLVTGAVKHVRSGKCWHPLGN
eukprot:sb/3474030/